MLEAAVHDRAQELRLQEEVLETGAVNADVALLDRLARLGALNLGRFFLLLVVEELLLLLDGFVGGHRVCGCVF